MRRVRVIALRENDTVKVDRPVDTTPTIGDTVDFEGHVMFVRSVVAPTAEPGVAAVVYVTPLDETDPDRESLD